MYEDLPRNKGKTRQEHENEEKWILAYLFQSAQSNFGAKHLLHTIPEASDDDKLAEFGQNPAEFDDNDDIILLSSEMCLIM